MHARSSFRIVGLSLVMCLLAWSGCGSDGGKKKLVFDAGPDSSDGTADFDADVPLQMKHDAGKAPPGEAEKGLMGRCAVDTNKIFTVVEGDQPFAGTPLAVNQELSEFALPYLGTSMSCFDSIMLATLKGANTAPAPKSQIAVDPCGLVRAPAVTAADDHWLLASVDNHLPPWDVWVTPFDSIKGKMGASVRISETDAEEKDVAVISLRDGTAMVAWSDDAPDGSGSLYVRSIDAMGQVRGDAHLIDSWNAAAGTDPATNPKLRYGNLVLTTLGTDGAGLAYWRYDPIGFVVSDIVFVALDNLGAPVRAELVLTNNAGQFASVDVDVNEEGGAIIYTQAESQTGLDLWFREIDDMGQPATVPTTGGVAPSVRFLSAPLRGIDVSVSKLRSQYAIVYRSLPQPAAAQTTKTAIRLQFLDRAGGSLGSSDISFTSDSGGRTSIKSAYDGRAVLGWTEVNEMGHSVIKVARLGCIGG